MRVFKRQRITKADGEVKRSRQSGEVAMELALIAPLMLFLMVGGVEMSRVLWAKNALRDAAVEGARVAVMSDASDQEVITAVENRIVESGMDLDALNPSITVSPREQGQPVQVTVEGAMSYLMLPTYLTETSDLETLSATAMMQAPI